MWPATLHRGAVPARFGGQGSHSMVRKSIFTGFLVAVMALLSAAAAQAQTTTSVNLGVGWFMLRGEDSRANDDVLIADLQSLAFNVSDFNGPMINGEWLIGVGDRLEFGVGVGFFQRTVPSVYAEVIDDLDGSEIEQDLKLRMIPMTATVKFLPIGRAGDFQPYVGGGVSFINWKYSEIGDFVDFSDGSIFHDRYIASGTAVAPVAFGGVRIPFDGDVFAFNGELRWQGGKGDTSGEGLLADRIDLGGFTALASFQIRF